MLEMYVSGKPPPAVVALPQARPGHASEPWYGSRSDSTGHGLGWAVRPPLCPVTALLGTLGTSGHCAHQGHVPSWWHFKNLSVTQWKVLVGELPMPMGRSPAFTQEP